MGAGDQEVFFIQIGFQRGIGDCYREGKGGGGELKIITRHEKDHIRVEVSNPGKGTHPDDMNKIFNPFFTTKEVGKWTRLGLHVILQIVEKYDGTIEVDSEMGRGTTFTIKFSVTM